MIPISRKIREHSCGRHELSDHVLKLGSRSVQVLNYAILTLIAVAGCSSDDRWQVEQVASETKARATREVHSDSGMSGQESQAETNTLQIPNDVTPVAGFGTGKQFEDQFRNLDPNVAGWMSEAFADAAAAQFDKLGKLIADPTLMDVKHLEPIVTANCQFRELGPSQKRVVLEDGSVTVRRGLSNHQAAEMKVGPSGLLDALNRFSRPLRSAAERRVKFKIVDVRVSGEFVVTRVLVHCSGRGDKDPRRSESSPVATTQINTTWECRWTRESPPRLLGMQSAASVSPSPHHQIYSNQSDDEVAAIFNGSYGIYEEITAGRNGQLGFDDVTSQILGDNTSFHSQLVWSYDHWRARSDRALISDLVGNHGIVVGDLDGDQLDDVLLLQPGGLPNRVFRHNVDGTASDVSSQLGLDVLDFSRSALIVDLDNDGDQDVVVGLAWALLAFENKGPRKFHMHPPIASHGQVHSLSAVDYDRDGDLDVYVCGRYSDGALSSEQKILGLPLPIHDANNGGPNTMFRNDGSFEFLDVTREVGLDKNNRRFTLAAAWEDYDNDGDQDLYVANDFGRNNLYRNDDGSFTDIAASAGVEDIGPGMSVTWSDVNGDGFADLYVSNMFSSAGSRITSQSQFMHGVDPTTRSMVRRFARGNSLYINSGDGKFRDATLSAGVNVGRWAWSSNFMDLNNDGLDDLVVANGFITADNPDDL